MKHMVCVYDCVKCGSHHSVENMAPLCPICLYKIEARFTAELDALRKELEEAKERERCQGATWDQQKEWREAVRADLNGVIAERDALRKEMGELAAMEVMNADRLETVVAERNASEERERGLESRVMISVQMARSYIRSERYDDADAVLAALTPTPAKTEPCACRGYGPAIGRCATGECGHDDSSWCERGPCPKCNPKTEPKKLKFFCNHGEIDCPKCQPKTEPCAHKEWERWTCKGCGKNISECQPPSDDARKEK